MMTFYNSGPAGHNSLQWHLQQLQLTLQSPAVIQYKLCEQPLPAIPFNPSKLCCDDYNTSLIATKSCLTIA